MSFEQPEFKSRSRDELPKEYEKMPSMWKAKEKERAIIRPIRARRLRDYIRYQEIDAHPEAEEWMVGKPMTHKEIKDFIGSNSRDGLIYGITGEKLKGELAGWVQLVQVDDEMLERIRNAGLIEIPQDSLALEISYANPKDRNLSEEKRERGLISSGVRQICYSLNQKLREGERESEKSGKKIKNPNLVIIAYTNPNNIPSEMVLKSSCFKNKGKMIYDPEENLEYDNFWVLDWEELEERFSEKTN